MTATNEVDRAHATGGVVHGGLDPAELEALDLEAAAVRDLSANLHPRGPHPQVLAAAASADVTRYPHPQAGPLRDALAARAGLPPAQVLVTAGSTAAIHLAARALLQPGERCHIFPPTFGEYEAAIRAAGGRVTAHRAEPPLFQPALAVPPAPLAMLCNPNNPTGVYLDRPTVETLLDRLGGVLLLDVAYDPFVASAEGAWEADELVRAGAPVLVVHSMTKLHAIPGLRLGYVAGPEVLIERLRALHHSWAVGAPALAAGLAALCVDAQQRATAAEVALTRSAIARGLRAAGLTVVEGSANFLLVRVGAATAFRSALLPLGFAVRDCTSFGLPQWVRVAVPPPEAVDSLIAAVAEAHAAVAPVAGGADGR